MRDMFGYSQIVNCFELGRLTVRILFDIGCNHKSKNWSSAAMDIGHIVKTYGKLFEEPNPLFPVMARAGIKDQMGDKWD